MKRIVRPMLGFKTFDSARCALRGIELMYMINYQERPNARSRRAAPIRSRTVLFLGGLIAPRD